MISPLADAIPLPALRRALIIKLGHHGDVLLASPVLSALKAHAAQLEIDALVYADTAPMLALHPALAQLHCIDRTWKNLGWVQRLRHEFNVLRGLRTRHYDLIVLLSNQWRGAHIVRLCQPRFSVASALPERGRRWQRIFTHHVKSPRLGFRHVVESNLDALRRLGLYPTPTERRLILVNGKPAEERAQQLLAEKNLSAKKFIHIHPASRWHFKCWPTQHMAALITRLQRAGWPVLLTAAPDQKEMAMIDEITQHLTQPVACLTGEINLKELAALSAQARLFIGVDSAPMHIAAAMNTPVVALFGPSGEGHWAPWMTPARVVANNTWRCRPCGIDGCGGSKVSECLTTLEVEHVFAASQELLQETSYLDR